MTICSSHEPLATPLIIARVSILQAWVIVQGCCHFNDLHWWDFPPPISTILVVGCSVRGRSHVCCESFSTVSSFFLLSFKSNLQTRLRNHPSGLTSPWNLLLSNRFSPFASSVCDLRSSLPLCTGIHLGLLPCDKSIGPSERMISNPQSFPVRCTYTLLWRASPNDVIMTSFV